MSRRKTVGFACAGLVYIVCLLGDNPLRGQARAAQPPPPPPPPSAAPGAVAVPAPVSLDPSTPLPSFEVGSVKKIPKDAKTTSSTIQSPGGGRIRFVNLPLRTIILQSYGLPDYQVIGGPGWMTTDRFTITAKAETNAPRDQLMLMMRSLLKERFNFKYHVEKRELPMYALMVLGNEWKPSARMKQVECTPGRGAPTPDLPRALAQSCGTMLSSSSGGIRVNNMPMSTFASLLGSLASLGTVHDRTGLKGNYQIELDASPSRLLSSSSLGLTSSASTDLLPSVGDGPSITAALKDIGLKLERRKEPIEVIVIDSVSQPDED